MVSMFAFSSFSACWSELQRLRPTGLTNAWSIADRTRSTFEIVEVDAKQVIVKLSSGKLRKIAELEFEKVFDRWQDYLSERLSRQELQNLTQNSTYIITILHLLEIQKFVMKDGKV
jgi:hypothetical protein